MTKKAIQILEFYLEIRNYLEDQKNKIICAYLLRLIGLKKTKKYKTLKEAITDYMKSKIFDRTKDIINNSKTARNRICNERCYAN